MIAQKHISVPSLIFNGNESETERDRRDIGFTVISGVLGLFNSSMSYLHSKCHY